MIVTSSIARVRSLIKAAARNKSIGFVPTMGALHPGHLSLVKRARQECGFVAVSIFINPAQFGPAEDYRSYPRNLARDKDLLKREGVDLVFCPRSQDIYQKEFSTWIEECSLSKALCGPARPGHFKGVCTVVGKLFNIIQPDLAYFGQKDYQQALIIKRMVRDLDFNLKIRILPIIRAKDGLALSSRNAYLRARQRREASVLYSALNTARVLIGRGQRSPKQVVNKLKKMVSAAKTTKVDYIKVVDAQTLQDLKIIKGKVLVALAVYVGKTRLIDNIIIKVGAPLARARDSIKSSGGHR